MSGTERRIQQAREEREYRFSETRHLMKFGVHPERIADGFGITTASLHRQAERWGADDIATYIGRPHRPTAWGECDCGNRKARKARQCIDCRLGVSA